MTQQKKCKPIHPQTVCSVCNKFLNNHLPWELNSCFEKNPKWFREVFNLP